MSDVGELDRFAEQPRPVVVPAVVEGPVALTGDVDLRGQNVAGRDLYVLGAGDTAEPPFLIIDQTYLRDQALKDKRPYVARSPDWADVVHGADPDVGFLERDQTEDLRAAIIDGLLDPCQRGTDAFLHMLAVLGPPGAGKSTLVRRVAAMLVEEGHCVVADFGISTEAVRVGDFDKYEAALQASVPDDKPLLVVLDDPFFANSGWVDFLLRLSRGHGHRIAILAASPDFLFERFTRALFSRRVVGTTFNVVKPSERERRELAVLYGRDPSVFAESDEDLLVVAMEAAAGESFRSIISRMWTTLNDGVAPDPLAPTDDLPWAVVAFAVVCYFHRNYVRCPEPILRQALESTLTSTPPDDLARKLNLLVTQEGWKIFSTRAASTGHTASTLVGATHARVAREALAHFPLPNLDIQLLIINASVKAPDDTAQLAELLLATAGSTDTRERGLVARLAGKWAAAAAHGGVEPRAVSSLTRSLAPSRGIRMRFRGVLRASLKRSSSSESWLVVWQLFQLATKGSDESRHLRDVALPRSLRAADLSHGSSEIVEIARLGGSIRQLVIERLVNALQGAYDWRPDGAQVSWLIRTLPQDEVRGLLEAIQIWLDDGLIVERRPHQTSDSAAVQSLLHLLVSNPRLDAASAAWIVDTAFEWLVAVDDPQPRVIGEAIRIAETEARLRDAELAERLVTEVARLMLGYDELQEESWVSLLLMLRGKSDLAGATQQIVPEFVEWLWERQERSDPAWSSALTLARLTPGLAGWIREAVPVLVERLLSVPDLWQGAWSALLRLVGGDPAFAPWAEQTVPRIAEWLLMRDESEEGVWSSLLTHAAGVPTLRTWSVREVPVLAEWLRVRPEANEGSWTALLGLAGRTQGLEGWVVEEVPRLAEWLRARPEGNEGIWSALLSLAGRTEGLHDWVVAEVPQIADWLLERGQTSETTWSALLSLAGRTAELESWFVAEIPGLQNRLMAGETSNQATWSALITLAGRTPALEGWVVQEIPRITEWLYARPGVNEYTWSALITVAGRSSGLQDWVVQEIPRIATWMRSRPDDYEGSWSALLSLAGRTPALTTWVNREIPVITAWLRERTGANESIWAVLISLAAHSPVVDATFDQVIDWLRGRPEFNESVWGSLLAAVRLENASGRAERVVREAVRHIERRDVTAIHSWATLLSTATTVPLSGAIVDEVCTAALWWVQRTGANVAVPWLRHVVTLVDQRRPHVVVVSDDTRHWLDVQSRGEAQPPELRELWAHIAEAVQTAPLDPGPADADAAGDAG